MLSYRVSSNARDEILPGLWVGSIMSVCNIEDLIQRSSINGISQCSRELFKDYPNSTGVLPDNRITEVDHSDMGTSTGEDSDPKIIVTVVSILSNPKSIEFVSDILEQQCKNREHISLVKHISNSGRVGDRNAVSGVTSRFIDDSNDLTQALNCSIGENQKCEVKSRHLENPVKIEVHHVVFQLQDTLDSDLMNMLPDVLDAIDKALIGVYPSCRLLHPTVDYTEDNPIPLITCKDDKLKQLANCHPNCEEQRICLVHCAMGASRSIAIIVAYLLSRYNNKFNTYEDALNYVRKVRPKAKPNARFASDLRHFAEER